MTAFCAWCAKEFDPSWGYDTDLIMPGEPLFCSEECFDAADDAEDWEWDC